jgi:phospholipid/cholesterol/gamma-HCH transport system substrate-binding protein
VGEKLRYTLVGVFVLLFSTGLIGVTLWLSTGTEGKVYRTYLAYSTESVAGLNAGSDVKYRGVRVGAVREISLDPIDPQRVQLRLDIEQGVPVRQGTVARLALKGVTGIAYLELSGGRKDAPLLQPVGGSPYPVIAVGPSRLLRLETTITSVLAGLQSVAHNLEQLSQRMNRVLSDTNQTHLARLLENLNTFSELLASNHNRNAVKHLLHNASRSSDRLPLLADHLDRVLEEGGQTLQTLSRNARRLGDAAVAGQGDIRGFLSDADARVEVLLASLGQLVETLQRMADTLEQDPSRLLRGAPAIPPGPGERR